MVAFVVVFSETAAVAQDSKPASSGQAEPATRGRALPVANLSPLLEALDSNHDGVIDAEEVANASEALAALDKNSDGQLTPDEYQAAVRRAPSSGRRPPWPVNPNTPRLPPVPGGGLGNFGFVDEHLLRGAQPSTVGIQTLRALGVTTILDLTLPDRNGQAEKAEAERNRLVYTNMPMDSVVRLGGSSSRQPSRWLRSSQPLVMRLGGSSSIARQGKTGPVRSSPAIGFSKLIGQANKPCAKRTSSGWRQMPPG
jgi:hypothetical protein